MSGRSRIQLLADYIDRCTEDGVCMACQRPLSAEEECDRCLDNALSVRCSECRWYLYGGGDVGECLNENMPLGIYSVNGLAPEPGFGCSLGERKE